MDGHWIIDVVVALNREIRKDRIGCFGGIVNVFRVIVAVQESVVIEAFRDFLRPHLPFVGSPSSGLEEKINRAFIDGIAPRMSLHGAAAMLLVLDRINILMMLLLQREACGYHCLRSWTGCMIQLSGGRTKER